ncbi:MAG TPA: hypothetical protein VE398_04500 [Acidobacteriota bacterium]|nr:hypothetical protein [Acidobacteriota bacterium]
MKTKTLLIAAVMFLGLTAAAFAQATFSVGSIPVTAIVNTGQVELTGDITFSQISNGNASVLGTITVTYPVPITVGRSDTNGAVGSGVRIASNTGNYTLSLSNPPPDQTSVGILSVSSGATTGQGQVVIQVPAVAAGNGSFTLTGVRVAVAGTTLTSLNATISATNNAITANQTNVLVVASIAPGIQAPETDPVGSLNATTGAVLFHPVITIPEGFLNAWGDPTNSTNAGVRITLSAAPPAGVTITFPQTASSDGASPVANPEWRTINSDGADHGGTYAFTSASTSLVAYYKATSTTDPTKLETLTIPVALAFSGASNLPLPVVTITYLVSMAPIGNAFGSNNALIASPIPRYAAQDLGPATLLRITGTTTTILIPFAQTATAAGYNTGFAIANTTEDPGSTVTSFTPPVAQSGTITFYFFPQLPAPGGTNPANFSYTTGASSPGTGLDASGRLMAGSTYTVLLSQLLAAAGAPADFAGYVFVVTNFTNAHCLYVVSNFTTFSQGSLGLIIAGDRTIVPEHLNN